MRKDLLAYFALAAICLIWGTTYLALRIAVMHFPPFLFVGIRQIIAGSLLIGSLMLFKKYKWPELRCIGYQAIAGFFMITLGNGLVAWAEMHIPSGIAAVMCSLMPVMVIAINLTVNREERPNIPIMVGIALGFVGITMIFGQEMTRFADLSYLFGILLTFTAILAWAGGSVWIKKQKTQTNLFLNAGLQMFFGGLWLLPLSLVFDDLTALQWSSEAGFALLYLTLFGSIVAFTCYSYALSNLPMTIVSLYAYINPIVAVILGWLILDEKLNATMGIAILITIAGIYIVNRGYQLRDIWKAQFSANR
jgi:drug/metabolite transporter (DMT)-like permease